MPHYTYRAEGSPNHGAYLGSCLEMPWMIEVAPTAPEAVARVEKEVDEKVATMVAAGERPPASFTEKRYSGKFLVRVPLSLHARLTIEAAEQRVSMNQWVVHKLVEKPIRPDDW